jgi:phage terminase large subunit GpA-like protein
MLRNYAIPQDKSIDISNDSTYESIEVPIQVAKDSLNEIKNVTNEKSHVPTLLPQILKKSKVSSKQHEFLNLFKNIHINIPLLDSIKQVLVYAKFLKDLYTIKRKLSV